MPATCCVMGCNNRHSSSKKLRFYRIPRGKDQRCKFIGAIARHRSWEPNNSTRICSIHFESGAINKNKNDVDYAPTLYMDFGKESERDHGQISLHEHMTVSAEPNETEFRDHITKLIDEASIMLKQREDNCLTQSLLFHDYVMPYDSHPVAECVDSEVCTSVPTPAQEPHCISSDPDWHQTGSQDINSSGQDISGRSLDVVMMMSSTSLHPGENLEHFWVADALLRMRGSPTYIASPPGNTLCPTTDPIPPIFPLVSGAPLPASAVPVVL